MSTPEIAVTKTAAKPTIAKIAERAIYVSSLNPDTIERYGSTYAFDLPLRRSTAYITVPGLVDTTHSRLAPSMATGIDISVYAPGKSVENILDIPAQEIHLFMDDGSWTGYEATAYGRHKTNKHVLSVIKGDSMAQYDEIVGDNGTEQNNRVIANDSIIATDLFKQVETDTVGLLNTIARAQ